jgi:hypothetical protein
MIMADLGSIGFGRHRFATNVVGVSYTVSGEVRDSSGSLVGGRRLICLTQNAQKIPTQGFPTILGNAVTGANGLYTVSTGMNTSDVIVVCLDPTLNAKVSSQLTSA